MLYERNYSKLTTKEQADYNKAKEILKNPKGVSATHIDEIHELLSEAGHHYDSLFPNNYIFFNYIKHKKVHKLFDEFRSLLNTKTTLERDIQRFIKEKEAYFIIESLFTFYDFGHHDAYLFYEFPFPPNYSVDYLLVGKNSGGYEFLFIELESPNQSITLKDGRLGESYRKGIKQIEDWDFWIDSNFSSLKNVFKKHKSPRKELPIEFFELDKTRIHYLVIAGKRKHYTPETYRLRRKGVNNISIKHYDNLIDSTEKYINEAFKNSIKSSIS
ncbi:Shedu anti-phage system protein SduA domain-containing protein [Salibacter halophilus]|uniref:DUF4263 domain-containing protein n=1 Tax=Salibacter halophilus TaxID=1803916 RepID=A0A6N6M5D9_9FLAO|nr:Shedu anti-phage system protein SduA domain-containing protein [Salibacter halophilus]KAB1064733.1 DUF4263 domain-containing protein [Salibacter halophilus]